MAIDLGSGPVNVTAVTAAGAGPFVVAQDAQMQFRVDDCGGNGCSQQYRAPSMGVAEFTAVVPDPGGGTVLSLPFSGDKMPLGSHTIEMRNVYTKTEKADPTPAAFTFIVAEEVQSTSFLDYAGGTFHVFFTHLPAAGFTIADGLCSSLINATMADDLLGAGATCAFEDVAVATKGLEELLRVTYGMDTSNHAEAMKGVKAALTGKLKSSSGVCSAVLAGSQTAPLAFTAPGLFDLSQGHYFSGSVSVNVPGQAGIPLPAPHIEGPHEVGTCIDATIDGSSSALGWDVGSVNTTWSLVKVEQKDALTGGLTEKALGLYKGLGDWTAKQTELLINVKAGYLAAGHRYTFQIRLTDCLGRSSTASKAFEVISARVPSLSIITGEECSVANGCPSNLVQQSGPTMKVVKASRASPVIVDSAVTFPVDSCPTTGSAAVNYTWRRVPEDAIRSGKVDPRFIPRAATWRQDPSDCLASVYDGGSSLGAAATLDSRRLYLPAFCLDSTTFKAGTLGAKNQREDGANYFFELMASFGSAQYYSSAVVMVQVSRMDLVALIGGGQSINHGAKEALRLSAAASYDPEYPAGVPKPTNPTYQQALEGRFQWGCQKMVAGQDLAGSLVGCTYGDMFDAETMQWTSCEAKWVEGCLFKCPCDSNLISNSLGLAAALADDRTKAAELVLEPQLLEPDTISTGYSHHVFTVTYAIDRNGYFKDWTPSATASVVVHATVQNPPQVGIDIVAGLAPRDPSTFIASKGGKVFLDAGVQAATGASTPVLLQWDLKYIGGLPDVPVRFRPQSDLAGAADAAAAFTTPITLQQAAIDTHSLQTGGRYLVTVSAHHRNSTAEAQSQLEFVMNQAPSGGECSVCHTLEDHGEATCFKSGAEAALQGEALNSDFLLQCNGWADPEAEGKLTYVFGHDAGDGGKVVVARSESNSMLSALPSSPRGGRATLFFHVVDVRGASVELTLKYSLKAPADVSSVGLSLVDKAIERGDVEAQKQAVDMVISSLNQMAVDEADAAGTGAPLSAAEQKQQQQLEAQQKQQRKELRAKALDVVASSSSALSAGKIQTEDVEATAVTVASIIKVEDEVEESTVVRGLQVLSSVFSLAGDVASESKPLSDEVGDAGLRALNTAVSKTKVAEAAGASAARRLRARRALRAHVPFTTLDYDVILHTADELARAYLKGKFTNDRAGFFGQRLLVMKMQKTSRENFSPSLHAFPPFFRAAVGAGNATTGFSHFAIPSNMSFGTLDFIYTVQYGWGDGANPHFADDKSTILVTQLGRLRTLNADWQDLKLPATAQAPVAVTLPIVQHLDAKAAGLFEPKCAQWSSANKAWEVAKVALDAPDRTNNGTAHLQSLTCGSELLSGDVVVIASKRATEKLEPVPTVRTTDIRFWIIFAGIAGAVIFVALICMLCSFRRKRIVDTDGQRGFDDMDHMDNPYG